MALMSGGDKGGLVKLAWRSANPQPFGFCLMMAGLLKDSINLN